VYRVTDDGQLVWFSDETHLGFLFVGVVRTETPLGVEERWNFGQKTKTDLLVDALLPPLLPNLLQSEDVDSPTIAAAGQPLRTDIESYWVDSCVIWTSPQFLDAFSSQDVENTDKSALLGGCG
jgi:hypothetical protein